MKKILAIAGTVLLISVPVAVGAQGTGPPPDGTVGVVTYQIQNGVAVQIGEVQVVMPVSSVCLPEEAA